LSRPKSRGPTALAAIVHPEAQIRQAGSRQIIEPGWPQSRQCIQHGNEHLPGASRNHEVKRNGDGRIERDRSIVYYNNVTFNPIATKGTVGVAMGIGPQNVTNCISRVIIATAIRNTPIEWEINEQSFGQVHCRIGSRRNSDRIRFYDSNCVMNRRRRIAIFIAGKQSCKS